jgi:hypothetical protein
MNNERYNQIIDEAYINYVTKLAKTSYLSLRERLEVEEFISLIKQSKEFSEKWGLKIEERELSLEERNDIYKKQWEPGASELIHDRFDALNIPTKLITVTYKDEKIEVYENL